MSPIPAVLDALVFVANQVNGVTVFKGPPLKAPHERDVILVGFQDGTPSVAYSSTVSGLGSSKTPFDVNNTVTVWRGEAIPDPAVQRADTIMDELRQNILADMTLGGVVTRARITNMDVNIMQTSRGAVSEIPFTVYVEGFRDGL